MRDMRIIVFILISITFFISGCIGETTPPVATEFGSLKGYVYFSSLDSDEENPVEGANVSLKGTTYTVTTDVTGYFEIPKVGVGKYTLIVEKRGYETYSQDIEIKKDETLELSGENKIVLTPVRDEYLFNKGIELYNEKDYLGAVFYLSELKEDYPDSEYMDKALYYLGMSYDNIGLFNDAIYNFEDLILDYPESEYIDDAIFKLGDIYYALGNYEKSIYYYKKLLDEFSESKYVEKALYSLSMAYMQIGNTEKALESFDEFTIKFPDSEYADDATYFKGYIFYTEEKYNDAISVWETIPEEYSLGTWPDGSPILASTYFYLGEAYRAIGNIDEAKRYYEIVIKDFPEAQFSDGSLISEYAEERLKELSSQDV